jgi:hypothetical protein
VEAARTVKERVEGQNAEWTKNAGVSAPIRAVFRGENNKKGACVCVAQGGPGEGDMHTLHLLRSNKSTSDQTRRIAYIPPCTCS